MKITYLRHACFLLEGNTTVIIDPFLSHNSMATKGVEDLPKIDYVLITHDHADHLGDGIEIARKNKAKMIGVAEFAEDVKKRETEFESIGMNIGGTYREDGLAVEMVPAWHSCRKGMPVGFVITLDNVRIYHAGDTSFYSDMKLVNRKGEIDVAMLPIGGHYTMNEKAAAEAVKVIKPKLAIPMHFDTMPVIKADPEKFRRLCDPTQVKIMEVNEILDK